MKLNLDSLLEMLWEYLALTCIYTKKRGRESGGMGPRNMLSLTLLEGCQALCDTHRAQHPWPSLSCAHLSSSSISQSRHCPLPQDGGHLGLSPYSKEC